MKASAQLGQEFQKGRAAAALLVTATSPCKLQQQHEKLHLIENYNNAASTPKILNFLTQPGTAKESMLYRRFVCNPVFASLPYQHALCDSKSSTSSAWTAFTQQCQPRAFTKSPGYQLAVRHAV